MEHTRLSGFVKGGIVVGMTGKTGLLMPDFRRVLVFTAATLFLCAVLASGYSAETDRAVGIGRGSTVSLTVGGTPYPPLTDWKSITTAHNQLIFPAGHEKSARRAAALTAAAWEFLQEDFQIKVAPYPLILNTSFDVTNGYFGMAPRKSEWYAYPSQQQFAGAIDWYTLLALHEGRHAAQLSALDQGFIRWGRIFAGEYGWAGLSFYAVPLWYFEGDAILAETAFSGPAGWIQTESRFGGSSAGDFQEAGLYESGLLIGSAGRGRSAGFHREIRAVAQGEKFPSYQQAYLGSYKTHFPSYYHLGYPMVAYIRLMYGSDAWNEILRETARFAFWPLRFHRAVKKVTGRSVEDLYRETLDFLSGYWSEQARDELVYENNFPVHREEQGRLRPEPEIRQLTPAGKAWTNYYPAGFDEEGRLYAFREGDGVSAEIVRLETDGPVSGVFFSGEVPEMKRILQVSARDDWVDIKGEKAVWAEPVPHPLWAKVSFSDIFTCDLESGRRRRITRGEHLQAPVLSPDRKRIAAVEVSPGGQCRLILLDAETGKMMRTAEAPEAAVSAAAGRGIRGKAAAQSGYFFLHPSWSEDGGSVGVVLTADGFSSLFAYHLETDAWELFIGPTVEKIEYPRIYGNLIFYTSDYAGREEMYLLDRRNGIRYRICSSDIAGIKPLAVVSGQRFTEELVSGRSLSGDNTSDQNPDFLIYSDYSAYGFGLQAVLLESETLVPIPEISEARVDYGEPLYREMRDPAGISFDAVFPADYLKEDADGFSIDSFQTERYRPAAHLLNFHSWGALPDGEGRVELFAQSDDPLGFLSLQLFSGLNPVSSSYDTGFQGVYRRFFPILQFGASGDVHNPGDENRKYCGFTGFLGLEAPVNLSRGIWERSLQFESAAYIRVQETDPADLSTSTDPENQTEMILPLSHTISFFNASGAISPMDFSSPWLQYSSWTLYHVPVQEEYTGWRLEQRASLIFPGFFRHHRIQAGLDAEWEEGEEVPLSTVPMRPRGYSFDWNDGYAGDLVGSIEYILPLLSPDAALGNVYYLKRILCTFFSDAGIGGADYDAFSQPEELRVYSSSGVELTAEQHFFSWPVSIQAGIRLAYRWRDERLRVEDTLFTLGIEW